MNNEKKTSIFYIPILHYEILLTVFSFNFITLLPSFQSPFRKTLIDLEMGCPAWYTAIHAERRAADA